MPIAAGIIINIAEDRRAPLLAAIEAKDIGHVAWFAADDSVADSEHSRAASLTAFLCFESGKITHPARARRGMRAAIGLSRVNVAEATKLPIPVATA